MNNNESETNNNEMDDNSIREPVAFLLMPGDALLSLRNELLIMYGESETEDILQRYGNRCGEGLVRTIQVDFTDLDSVLEQLHNLWIEIGLGESHMEKMGENELKIAFNRSIEAFTRTQLKKPSCYFTQGHICGSLSQATGKGYDCIEEKCISMGDSQCIYHLTPKEEEVITVDERQVETEQKYDLEQGYGYVIMDETQQQGYEIFKDIVTHGFKGVCFTRDFPQKIQKKFDFENTPIYWLSTMKSDNAFSPNGMPKIYNKLDDFMKKNDNAAILLNGIEYLIIHNNFNSVLKFIQVIHELVAITNSILLLPIDPETFDKQNIKLIQRELRVFKEP